MHKIPIMTSLCVIHTPKLESSCRLHKNGVVLLPCGSYVVFNFGWFVADCGISSYLNSYSSGAHSSSHHHRNYSVWFKLLPIRKKFPLCGRESHMQFVINVKTSIEDTRKSARHELEVCWMWSEELECRIKRIIKRGSLSWNCWLKH